MNNLILSKSFLKGFRKLDTTIQQRVLKGLMKLHKGNYVKKHMSGNRKGTMEFKIGCFRMPYSLKGDNITLLKLYHKDEQ